MSSPVYELFGAEIGVADIRPVTDADLLGRHEIDTDIESIAGYVTGQRVLVTGAGGLDRLRALPPAAPVRARRAGACSTATSRRCTPCSSSHRGPGHARRPRTWSWPTSATATRMREVFAEHRPEVVFHAAALKHLPLLEMHPAEALQDQRLGHPEPARRRGARSASTASSTSPPTRPPTPRQRARATPSGSPSGSPPHAAERTDGTYLSVRFGNVLGSRGSVLTAFRAQIEAGGPVTVTDPDVTRYFMTVEEAVQLVIQAGAVGPRRRGAGARHGRAGAIDDVARRLVAEADRPIEIVYTGLRPGEKLHEVLFGDGRGRPPTAHPLISHCAVPAMSVADVALVAETELAEAGPPRLRERGPEVVE